MGRALVSNLHRISRLIYTLEMSMSNKISDIKLDFLTGKITNEMASMLVRAAQVDATSIVMMEIDDLSWEERVELYSTYPDARFLLSRVLTKEQIMAAQICGD